MSLFLPSRNVPFPFFSLLTDDICSICICKFRSKKTNVLLLQNLFEGGQGLSRARCYAPLTGRGPRLHLIMGLLEPQRQQLLISKYNHICLRILLFRVFTTLNNMRVPSPRVISRRFMSMMKFYFKELCI